MTYDEFLAKYDAQVMASEQRGRRLYFSIRDQDLTAMAQFLLKELGCRLSTATGMEVYDGIEVMYHFSDDREGRYFCPTVKTTRNNPEVTSITPLTKAASWIEREIHDMFGVVFTGHPNLKPLLKEDNEGIPGFPLIHSRPNLQDSDPK
jgi:NADH-quinone oxidoreductase subunit C